MFRCICSFRNVAVAEKIRRQNVFEELSMDLHMFSTVGQVKKSARRFVGASVCSELELKNLFANLLVYILCFKPGESKVTKSVRQFECEKRPVHLRPTMLFVG